MRIKTLIFFGMLICAPVCQAADKVPPGKYSLSVARVYESDPSQPKWVFILGGTGAIRGGETVCQSVAGLKKLLTSLPRDSTLDWYPTCRGESEVLREDVEDLKAICRKAGVTFTIHPSG